MSSNKNQVMTCGACAVIVDESGQVSTSIDMLVGGVRRLASKFGIRNSSQNTAATARI